MDSLKVPGIKPMCLGVTKSGLPRHPLYMRNDAVPVQYEGRTTDSNIN